MKNLFTSDTHFGHFNIIKYCNRPFVSKGEMNDEIIRRWNAKVNPTDTVYHLGDFAFGSAAYTKMLLERLNGKIVLIRGNHDRVKNINMFKEKGFEVYRDLYLPLGLNSHIYLTHRPIMPNPDICISYVLCGHIHNTWRHLENAGLRFINVGVDQWAFTPQTLYELMAYDQSTS